ncbi:class II histocompatibility antigen, B-L beta chain-like [Zonotrichia albicollis]|uniref:class II histocompatibility antigen, B-L beta chain-like n=1 Tax=Zonotrichia albicollis TaxID=44394 RepID=UPI003D80D5BE
MMFDSDVGVFVGDNTYGETQARCCNGIPEILEDNRAAVDTFCWAGYELAAPFLTGHRVPPSVSISLVTPSSSQPSPGRLLCSVMDFYPAAIQVRWFQGQQELSEHVVATDVVPNGDWTYQLLVLLETPPRRGLSYSCQVEHVSLEQPLRRHWGTGEPLGALAEPLGGSWREPGWSWERGWGLGKGWAGVWGMLGRVGWAWGGRGRHWEGVWRCWVLLGGSLGVLGVTGRDRSGP